MTVAADLATLVHDALDGRLVWRWADPSSSAEPNASRITAVSSSSAQVGPGTLFVCIAGRHHDGHDFASAAVAAGAVAVVSTRLVNVAVPQVLVGDTRRALGLLCAAHVGWPSRRLGVVGVTGTNGKTSTATLLGHILNHAGRQTSVRGTLTGAFTTPEAPELQHWLDGCARSGDRYAVMEVSSHALELERVAGTQFTLGVFTNLGHDHLDLHGTPERYFAAKARLFEADRCAAGVVNRDDVHGRLLADAATIPMTTYGRDDVSDVEVGRFRHRYRWRDRAVDVPLGGDFHVMNSLASATAATVLGVEVDAVVAALAEAPPVRGRFEVVDLPGQPTVVVDFAHTPDGLQQVLTTARSLVDAGRVIVVFGCGGDRDAAKRPRMGAVAARLADVVVLTSDNPRSEDPAAIIEAIRAGADDERQGRVALCDPDRRSAIAAALALAAPHDVVVVAGKGHETTQTLADRVMPFDDAAVVRDLLGALTPGRGEVRP